MEYIKKITSLWLAQEQIQLKKPLSTLTAETIT